MKPRGPKKLSEPKQLSVGGHRLLELFHHSRLGASNPVSHMSLTMTIRNGSPGSRKRLAKASRRALLRAW